MKSNFDAFLILILVAAMMLSQPVRAAQDQFDIAQKVRDLQIVNAIQFVRDGFWVEGFDDVAFVDNNGKIRFDESVGPGDGFQSIGAISSNQSRRGWFIVSDQQAKTVDVAYEIFEASGKISPLSLPSGEPVEIAAFGSGQAVVRTTQPDSLYLFDEKRYHKIDVSHISALEALSNGCVLMTSVNSEKNVDTLLKMCSPAKITKIFDLVRPTTVVVVGDEVGTLSKNTISIYNSSGKVDTVVLGSGSIRSFSFDSKSVMVVENTGSGLAGDVDYFLARRGTSGFATMLPSTDSFGISHWMAVGQGFLWLLEPRPTTLYKVRLQFPTL